MRSRTRLLILFLLYPWMVGFNGPNDSLPNTFSIFGGSGQYDHITRDCNNHITSVTEIPFQEVGGSVESPLADWVGYTLRGGYISAASGAGCAVFTESSGALTDSLGNPVRGSAGASRQSGYYGGGTLRLRSNFFGLDVGGLAFSRHVAFSEFYPSAVVVTGGLRVGHLDAWYITADFLNDDMLFSSRAAGSFGFGMSLGDVEEGTRTKRHSTLWLGLGGYPYDATLMMAKVSVPFNRTWTFTASGSFSAAQNFEGAVSAGLGYAW